MFEEEEAVQEGSMIEDEAARQPVISITSLDDSGMVEMMEKKEEEELTKKTSDKNLSVDSKRKTGSSTSSFYNSWTNPNNSLFRNDRYEETINMRHRNVANEFESLEQLLKRTGEEQVKVQRMETKMALQGMTEDEVRDEEASEAAAEDKPKIGTWDGVFASCILNIFGVIMFLRLPWVVGQAGIWLACGIILLSGVVVLLTAVSMYVIGFCETLVGNVGIIFFDNPEGDPINDI